MILAVGLIFSALGGAGWTVSRQLVDLATRLPEYKGNLVAKLHAFQPSKGGMFSKVSDTVDELKKELPGGWKLFPPVVAKNDRTGLFR